MSKGKKGKPVAAEKPETKEDYYCRLFRLAVYGEKAAFDNQLLFGTVPPEVAKRIWNAGSAAYLDVRQVDAGRVMG